MFDWWKKRQTDRVERRAFEKRILEQLLLRFPKEITTQPAEMSALQTSISSVPSQSALLSRDFSR